MDNSEELGHWKLAPWLENPKNLQNLAGEKVNFCSCSSRFTSMEEAVGFVYLVTGPAGAWYLGRKLLTRSATLPPLAGRKNKRRRRLESNWKEYTTSSPGLNREITASSIDLYHFTILAWCRSNWDLAYLETAAIIHSGALFNKRSYNGYLRCRLGAAPNASDHADFRPLLNNILGLLPTDN